MKDIWPKHLSVSPESISRCSRSEARALLPYDLAAKHSILPLGILSIRGKEVLHILTREGEGPSAINTLKFRCGLDVRVLEVPAAVVEKAIFLAYCGDDNFLLGKIVPAASPSSPPSDSLYDFRSLSGGDAGSLLSAIVDYAITKNASDIHLLPRRDGAYLRLRCGGDLITSSVPFASLKVFESIVNRLKVISKLDTTLKSRPQDGSFSLGIPGSEIFVRIGTFPTLHGERVALRLISEEGVTNLTGLGLSENLHSSLLKASSGNEGMILFSGPTGSGKSTSMYSLMKELAKKPLNLMSVEDPIEVRINEISQSEVSLSKGLTYGASLRAILRQDPDVILIGEIRDTESASLAFNAAVTGHLVVSTVHGASVLDVFLRLSHLEVDSLTISQALKLVISQRLLPSLCASCAVIDLLGTNKMGFEVLKPVGCFACDYSGFLKKILVTEFLVLDANVRDLLRKGTNHLIRGAREAFTESNFEPLISSLDSHLRDGRISLSQYERFISSEITPKAERLHARS